MTVDSSASLHEKVLEISGSSLVSKNISALSPAVQRRLFIGTLILVDILTLVVAFLGAYFLRFETGFSIFYNNQNSPYFSYLLLSVCVLPLWLALFWMYHLYDWQTLLGGMQEYANIFQACLTGGVVLALSEFVLKWIVARGWVGLFCLFTFLLMVVGRFTMRRLAYGLRRNGYLTSVAVIVGANEEARALGEQILAWPTSGMNLIGFVDDRSEVGSKVFGRLPVIGTLSGLDEIVAKYQVEELIIASSAVERESLVNVFKRYGVSPNVRLHLTSGLFEIITTGLRVKEIASVSLINVNRARLTGTDVFLKTLLDYGLALPLLVCLAPLFLLIAFLIKLDSPGPILYRRKVMGLNGSQFDAFKFRTMHIDGDALLTATPELLDELATKHKIKGDPRITRIGQFLRKYSLDELPQLFNVLRREMSLVGPRMISPPELKNYGQWAMNLLTVRPGITGLWQVSGRSDVSYEDRVRLDMFYIRNYNIWLDLHLILRTIPVVIKGEGAY
jgi:exopolysaccharide biosynthesis polyprenyl glycosylphosphotransferase